MFNRISILRLNLSVSAVTWAVSAATHGRLLNINKWRNRVQSNEPSLKTGGPGSVVGIATGYGLNGPGIESRWGGEIFRTCPDRPWGPSRLLYNGYRVFPGVKSGRGVTLTRHPLLVPWSRKSRVIPLFPYGPYGLYRGSVPEQGCILPLPLPLKTGTQWRDCVCLLSHLERFISRTKVATLPWKIPSAATFLHRHWHSFWLKC